MQLYHQSTGMGEPIILLHGLFGSADNWGIIAKQLSQHYQVISVDLRNHGRSPHHDSQTYAEMADDLLAFSGKHKIKRFHLLGHSLGGKVAMQFAATYPERLKKLIVVDMAMRAYPDEHSHLIDAMLNADLSTAKSRSDVDKILQVSIPNTMVRQFLLMNLVKEDTGLQWRIHLPAIKANYPALLQALTPTTKYHQPSLFIHGERSDYIAETDIEDIKARFTQAEFTSLPTGHWVHAEQPDAFYNVISNFLRS